VNEVAFPDITQLKATPPHPIQLRAPDLTGEGKHQGTKAQLTALWFSGDLQQFLRLQTSLVKQTLK